MKYILSIDQGTTSTRAMIFDKLGNNISSAQMEFTQIIPAPGYVLHNPLEIWETVLEVIKEVLRKNDLTLNDINSIGITNQRETTVMWDKYSGEPIYNAIVWQSRQSQKICDDLIEKGYKDLIYNKTGLLINPYFSASKIKYILDETNKYDEAKKGNILFGTIDTWLLWKFNKGHFTDVTNASRTMLYNINTLQWDDELLELFNIPKEILPKVVPSSYNFGSVMIDGIEGSSKITSLVGDQQASLFGQCCFNEGDIKNTYGTGCFMLMNTSTTPVYSKNGLLTTIAYGYDDKVYYALEGSVFVAGALIQWLRDGLKIIKNSNETEEMAKNGSMGCMIVPAFVGLGTPYWDNDVRGSILGLTRGISDKNICAAALEAIAFQSRDVLEVMVCDAHSKINSLSVDGGASVNNYLMQFQSDLLNIKITRPTCKETTALGAAYLAGLYTGFYKSIDDIKKFHSIEKLFYPNKKVNEMDELYNKWKLAVKATQVFK